MAEEDRRPPPAAHYHGHRERLKTGSAMAARSPWPTNELLELILFQVLPRRDTKPIAKALLDRFGTFSEVLSAPEALLAETAGVGDSVVHHLKLVRAACQRFARDPVRTQPCSIHGRR